MKFRIKPADTFIWNLSELIDFLIQFQKQSIVIENGTEGCCARTVGLYHWLDQFEFADVTILTSNSLERHDRYQVKIKLPWKFLQVAQPIDTQWQVWNKRQVFGTVYGRPLWHRLGIAAHLLTNHRDISAVGIAVDPADVNQRELFELTQLWPYAFVELP